MRHVSLAAILSIALSTTAFADQRFEATLAGHAALPAATFAAPPADAPPGLAVSGRFTGAGNLRNEVVESVPGNVGPAYGNRSTGLSLPFKGQPVQGFSGIKPAGDGSYWVLTDNGFGTKKNSPDAMLMFHRVRPDFSTGKVTVERTVFVSDPNRIVPFNIATDATDKRYLTGADFDPESIQPMKDGTFWIGEEFGPFLIHVDAEGRVLKVVETMLDGQPLRSPDNPALTMPATPAGTVAFRARRSGGYEGMAASPDGSTLYALLEQPLYATGSDKPEGAFLRILEFSTQKAAWTGKTMRYRLEPGATAIGDFNMIDDRRALVIERDNGEGEPGLACPAGTTSSAQKPCFAMPARFKRVYLIDLADTDQEGFVRKLGHIDLMAIRDPNRIARQQGDRPDGAADTTFTFPFFTIENVAMVDADHIIVGNDNNLPFSAGRRLTKADDNELILLRVPELLRAK